MLGTTIGHYRVIERLGEGGMGEVFLVEDLKLQRRAALKLISPNLTRDETRRQRFLQEARLAASIDHPHIAAVHDIGEVDDRTYIAMEYVEGRSLREALREGPLKLRRTLDLAIQAGDALAKVHQHGVIHRDLKPENLLITHDGYLKIIDFGLAKLIDPLAKSGLGDAATIADAHVRTADGVVLGTLGYMSPEQVRGDAVDARSDVFSFGAVLYEMVTGKSPFKKGSGAETISAILSEAPPAPKVDDEAVASELQRVLRKCLAKDPDARYQGVRDLVVDLRALRESLASGDSMSRSAVTSAVGAAPSAIRRPTWAWAAAAALILVVGVGAWWTMRQRSDEPSATQSEMPKRPAVAVLAFEVMSGGPDIAWLGKGLPSLLVTGLAQTPDIEVVGNERLTEAAKQIGAGALDSVERSRLGELSRRAGARFVVNGTIVQAGADLRIDARVEDLTSGAVTLAASVRGPDALALADELAARIRGGLNVQVAPDAVRKVADVASSSVDAYRAFTIGVEAQNNLRVDDAKRMLEEAIRLDPNFGLAYAHLAALSDYQGLPVEGRRLRALAAQHLDRMSERDAMLVRAGVARDADRLDESARILEDLVAKYPDSERAWMALTVGKAFENADRSYELLARAVKVLPYSPALQNLFGYAQLNTSRIEEALRTFETYVKLRPSEANALDSWAEGLLVAGDSKGALDRYDEAIRGGYSGAPNGKVWTLAVLGRYSEAFDVLGRSPSPTGPFYRSLLLSRLGRYREAVSEIHRIRSVADKNQNAELVVAIDSTIAAFALERGLCDAIDRQLEAGAQLRAKIPHPTRAKWEVLAEVLAGICDARRNRLDTARRHSAKARSSHQTTSAGQRWWVSALDGEIALTERDYARAERSFTSGEAPRKMFFARSGVGVPTLSFLVNNLVMRDGRARVAVGQGKLHEAIALYHGLLTPGPQQKWTAMLDPLHVIALARVLDKAGQRDAARVEYQRFLEFWKDADKELSELAEARAALAR
ncbi:MAG: protein kinase domain-containing protein [Vicinamibacterales bacterium]